MEQSLNLSAWKHHEGEIKNPRASKAMPWALFVKNTGLEKSIKNRLISAPV